MKFSIKDFFSKCDQIRSFLRICSHLLKESSMENFIFCVVINPTNLFFHTNGFSCKTSRHEDFWKIVAMKSFKDFEDITIQNSLGNNEKSAHLFFFFKKIRCKSPYSVRMWEKIDQKNSEHGQFLCSVHQIYRIAP